MFLVELCPRGWRADARVCAEDRSTEIMVLGEKGKSQLQRDMKKYFIGTVNDTGKARITFAMARIPTHCSDFQPEDWAMLLEEVYSSYLPSRLLCPWNLLR